MKKGDHPAGDDRGLIKDLFIARRHRFELRAVCKRSVESRDQLLLLGVRQIPAENDLHTYRRKKRERIRHVILAALSFERVKELIAERAQCLFLLSSLSHTAYLVRHDMAAYRSEVSRCYRILARRRPRRIVRRLRLASIR